MRDHLRARRDGGNVLCQSLRQAQVARLMQQFKTVNGQLIVLTQRHAGTPLRPAMFTLAASVELRAQNADNHAFFHLLSFCIKAYPAG